MVQLPIISRSYYYYYEVVHAWWQFIVSQVSLLKTRMTDDDGDAEVRGMIAMSEPKNTKCKASITTNNLRTITEVAHSLPSR